MIPFLPQASGKDWETPARGSASLLTGKPGLHGPRSPTTGAGLRHGAVSRATRHQEEGAVGVESLLCPREEASGSPASSALLVGGREEGQTSANMTSFSRSSWTKKINAIRSKLAAQARQSVETWASAGAKATFPLHIPLHRDCGVLCPSFKNPNSLSSQPSCWRSHASCGVLRVCQAAEHTASRHSQGHRRQADVLRAATPRVLTVLAGCDGCRWGPAAECIRVTLSLH